jgi:hypothetical protein
MLAETAMVATGRHATATPMANGCSDSITVQRLPDGNIN